MTLYSVFFGLLFALTVTALVLALIMRVAVNLLLLGHDPGKILALTVIGVTAIEYIVLLTGKFAGVG